MQDQSSFFNWISKLSVRLLQSTPAYSYTAIFLSLVSQAALMVGTLLPIKVVMLLGTPDVPAYIPTPFDQLSKDSLILLLTLVAVAMFTVYLASDKLCAQCIHKSCDKIVRQTGKVILFENQEELAKNAYQKIVTSIAGILFNGLVFVVVGIIYPGLFLLLTAVVFVSAPIARWLLNKSRRQRKPAIYNRAVQNLGTISFLLSFAFIVVDHLYLSAPSILLTIIALILSRQASSKFCAAAIDLADIANKREKVSAIFFEEHILFNTSIPHQDSLASMLTFEARENWLPEILAKTQWQIDDRYQISTKWLQTNVANVFALWIKNNATEQSCIIKLFDSNKKALAQHEASLLVSASADCLPAPDLIYTGSLNGLPINLLKTDGFSPLTDQEQFAELATAIKEKLVLWPVPDELRSAYLKAHPLLWQKLDMTTFEQLVIAADANEQTLITQIQQRLPKIKSALATLPVCLHNPNIAPHTVLANEQSALAYQWGQWGMDILGSQYPTTPYGQKCLRSAIDNANLDVNVALAEIASYLASLLLHLSQQRYLDALDLLPPVLERLDELSIS
ncbi:hypothetical protein [Gilvimarinus sp. DA14]|uniref:hypothetical protein n=1 Tax=Gilvimarinus sp. DA14 TaxID=2956798 RepID=UPI0020B784A7|nr:hypothetical protein [Gilvimarinus sp. DA14]UTF59307.1 hypothetical protein NHM04_12570 [Gilvimarinus sp. DA14]